DAALGNAKGDDRRALEGSEANAGTQIGPRRIALRHIADLLALLPDTPDIAQNDGFMRLLPDEIGGNLLEIGDRLLPETDRQAAHQPLRERRSAWAFTRAKASSRGTTGRGSSRERFMRARTAARRSACSSSSRIQTRTASRSTSLVEAYRP